MVFSFRSSADFHQGASCLPSEARGRQCVPCCYMFLIFIYAFQLCDDMNTESMNDVLFAGSHLYCAMFRLQSTTEFVDPEYLPKRIAYKGKTVFRKHKYVFSGFLTPGNPSVDGENYYELEGAFLKGCTLSNNGKSYFIMVFNGISVAIHFDGSKFFIFDSHSRNEAGLSCSDGKCILGSLQNIDDLCIYLRSYLNQASGLIDDVQFDLHLFSFSKRYTATQFEIQILDGRDGFKIKSITKRKRNQKESIDIHMKKAKNTKQTNTQFSHARTSAPYINAVTKSSQSTCYSSNATKSLKVISNFRKQVSNGPDYVCSCCTQTFFQHAMKRTDLITENYKNSVSRFTTQIRSVDNFEWICKSCFESVRLGKTPKFWINNGIKFPSIPKELELSNLEERLVSPRLPFMQLREMPRGGQINLKGNIVNVPADVNSTIKSLPRMIHENETIMLKLKRRLSYKHHVAFENVRPNKVFDAATWLVNNSVLFRNEGIVLNETWLEHSNDQDQPTDEDHDVCSDVNGETCNTSDGWTEPCNFDDRPTGNLDTCLLSIDFRDFNEVLSVAPGEKNSPIGLYQDFHSEALSFPSIFCGQSRVENCNRLVSLHYSDIAKWELRNVDRRVALCVPNIFFKLKRLQIKQIRDKVSLAIRKCKTRGFTFTAGDMLSPGFVDKLTMQNDGYKVLRTLRGSPPYWEAAKRDLFAMIRQLGIPTWFCSFSAAETKWEPLLKSLAKLVQGKDLTQTEIESLSWSEKCLLIKSDPVTCARYFDYRVQTFIKQVLFSQLQPIGVILDYFYRVEFQQRGSPHIHMIVWVKDTPQFGISSDASVSEFVDKYVSCCKDQSIPTLINYQTHRHAKTCRKRNKAVCRFNFPLPPLPHTMVLHPLEKSEHNSLHAENFEKMMSCLNDVHQADQEMLFEEFLVKIGIGFDAYIQCIRCTLTRPKVFLKRSVSESRINNYNSVLLKCWQANMDIQFILDPYSCVSYIVSYISKGQRGLSNLLSDACDEARNTDSDIRQQVRRIGNQFLTSVEIGAQEAVYLVLQLPLRRSTRTVIYVDTKRPDERTSLIKPLSELKNLPEGSKNVEMDSMLKRYKRRPKILERLCYADFCSWYELCKRQQTQNEDLSGDVELPENEYELDKDDDLENEEDIADCKIIKFPCGTEIKKRLKQKVIYSNVTPIARDKEEHFREKIMLYTHWRDDENDLIGEYGTFEESFESKLTEINSNQRNYAKNDDNFYESILENLETEQLESAIHPEAQHQGLLELEEGFSRSATHGCFDPGLESNDHEDYDLGEDLGVSRRHVSNEGLPQKEMDNDEYLHSVRTLNNEQKYFFYHILNAVKINALPFYTFLSGGAGCGKSVLIRAINQAIIKHFNHLRYEQPDSIKLLLCAPTGKAAHNIGGSTIHSAFCIPANQGFQYKPLDMQQLNTMRAKLHDLKVIIIDEISMVGRTMFNFINLRLKEIKGSSRPFGGVSILAVGDLYQLKPVMDAWVFSQVYRTAQLQCLGTNLWIDLFDFFELKEVMRQKDDHEFALLLNRLREGKHTDEDLEMLKSRDVQTSNVTNELLKHKPHLFCRRVDVSNHNTSVLSDLPSSEIINIEAIDSVCGNFPGALHDKIISKISLDPSNTMGLQKQLVLGKEMPGELCLNVDTSDGLTNGASCVIKHFDFRVENSTRCSIVWVEFEDNSIGQKWRTKYRHLYKTGIHVKWTPILETCRKFTFRWYKTYLIVRRQFPINLAAAKTIHKAQGSTMKEAVIDFGTKKIDHIHYVGLSRVSSLSGIHILQTNFDKISVSSDVMEEMERLRFRKQIGDTFPNLSCLEDLAFKICFHNCRSLKKHIDDVKQESNLLSADLVCFVETRLSGSLADKYQIHGFKTLSSNEDQSSHGIAVYYKDSVDICHFSIGTYFGIECALIGVGEDLVVGFLYCPPKFATVANFSNFISAFIDGVLGHFPGQLLRQRKIVLMGDFNDDYITGSRKISQLFQNRLNLKQLLQCSTTDYGSCLDHIYSNLSTDSLKLYGTLESYYSDHKPLYITFYQ